MAPHATWEDIWGKQSYVPPSLGILTNCRYALGAGWQEGNSWGEGFVELNDILR